MTTARDRTDGATLAGSIVLVTGANSGIGRAIALAVAAAGAAVVVHHLPDAAQRPATFLHEAPGSPAAAAVVGEIAAAGGRAAAVAQDLLEPDAPERLLERAEETLGPLDGLVNNAAHVERDDTALQASAGALARTFTVNAHAPALLTAGLARRCIARGAGAAVVNVSTDAARAFPGQLAYGASKAALEALTRSAAIDLGPHGVRVNAVAPGPVQTGWIDAELEQRVLPDIPLRRLGTPEDVAAAVVFLLGPSAAWITGQVIQVAGGHAL